MTISPPEQCAAPAVVEIDRPRMVTHSVTTPTLTSQTPPAMTAHGTIASPAPAVSSIPMASTPTRCAALATAATRWSVKTHPLVSEPLMEIPVIGTSTPHRIAVITIPKTSMRTRCAAAAEVAQFQANASTQPKMVPQTALVTLVIGMSTAPTTGNAVITTTKTSMRTRCAATAMAAKWSQNHGTQQAPSSRASPSRTLRVHTPSSPSPCSQPSLPSPSPDGPSEQP